VRCTAGPLPFPMQPGAGGFADGGVRVVGVVFEVGLRRAAAAGCEEAQKGVGAFCQNPQAATAGRGHAVCQRAAAQAVLVAFFEFDEGAVGPAVLGPDGFADFSTGSSKRMPSAPGGASAFLCGRRDLSKQVRCSAIQANIPFADIWTNGNKSIGLFN